MSSQQRKSFAAAPNQSYHNFGEMACGAAKEKWRQDGTQWFSGNAQGACSQAAKSCATDAPEKGHFVCGGGFVQDDLQRPVALQHAQVQAQAQAQAQGQAKSNDAQSAQAPSQSQDKDTKVVVIQSPAPSPTEPQESSCGQAFEHILRCHRCSRRLGKYCASVYAERHQTTAEQPWQAFWAKWGWLLTLAAIVAGFLWLRATLQPRKVVVAQLGYR